MDAFNRAGLWLEARVSARLGLNSGMESVGMCAFNRLGWCPS